MTAIKFTDAIITLNSVSSLPTHPTAPKAFGGLGYTSVDVKAAFDRLPRLICERFNALLDDVSSTGDSSLAAAMPTGITSSQTLRDLFVSIGDGTVLSYIPFEGVTLASYLAALRSDLDRALGALGLA